MPKISFDEWRKNESTLSSESKKYKGKKEEEDKKKKEESAKKPFEGLAAALPDPVRTTENGVRIQDSKTAEKRANARANYQNKVIEDSKPEPVKTTENGARIQDAETAEKRENARRNYQLSLYKNPMTQTEKRGDLYLSTTLPGTSLPNVSKQTVITAVTNVDLDNAKKEYDFAKTKYDNLQRQYDEAVKNGNPNQIQILGSWLDEAKKDFEQKEKAYKTAGNKSLNLDAALKATDTAKAEYDEAKAKYDNLKKQYNNAVKSDGYYEAIKKHRVPSGGSTKLEDEYKKQLIANELVVAEMELKKKEEAYNSAYEDSSKKHYIYYEQNRLADDFDEKSKYQGLTETVNPRYALGKFVSHGFDNDDAFIYHYINGNQDAQSQMALTDISQLNGFLGLEKAFLKTMEEKEISLYNYLYSESTKKAKEYLSYLQSDLYARYREKIETEAAEYAKAHHVLASVASVGTNLAKPLSLIGVVADKLDDGKLSENAPYNKYSYITDTTRETVSDIIEENYGPVGSYAYNIGMGIVDQAARIAVSGGSSLVSSGIMFTSSAADSILDAKDRGLSDGQAFALGFISGAAEMITEKISVDALLNKAGTKSAAVYFLKSAFAEGTEEASSNILNTLADVIIAKDKSQWATAMNYYMTEMGMDEKKAFNAVLKDNAIQLGLDTLAGAISGGALATPGTVVKGYNNIKYGKTDNSTAKNNDTTKKADVPQMPPQTSGNAQSTSPSDVENPQNTENVVNKQQNTPSDVPSTESVSKPMASATAELTSAEDIKPTADMPVDSSNTSVDISADTSVNGSVDTSVDNSVNASEEITVDPEFLEAFAEYEAAPENQPRNDKLPTAFPAPKLITEAEKFELYKYPPELRSRIRYADSLAEKTGVLYGASEETIKEAIELGNALGREVEFFSDDNTKIAGVFKDGTIKINVKAEKAAFKIFAHELTHSLKVVGNDSYQKLKAHVFSVLESEGKSREDAIKEKKAEYSAIQELNDESAEDEIVARFCEDRLFTDAESIKALTKTDRTLAQRMRYLIDRLLAKLGNKNANERAILEKARRLYESALAKSNDRDLSGGTVNSAAAEVRRVEGNDPYLKILASQLANGEITEAQFAEEYEDYVSKDKRISGARANLIAAESDRPRTLADMAEDFETEGGEEEYDIVSISNKFSKQIDDWTKGKMPDGGWFDLGTTSPALIESGAKKLPVRMKEDVILKFTTDYGHEISLDEAKNIPKALNNPLFVFKGSVPKSLVAVTELIDKNGDNVIVAIHLDNYQDRIFINRVASVYGKKNIENYIINNINNGKLVNINKADTKKVSNWFSSRGLQLPKLVQTILDTNNSISQNSDLSTQNSKKDFGNSKNGGGQFDYTPSSDEPAAVAENEERAEMGALETPETKAVDEVVFNMPKKAQNFIKRTEGAIVKRVAKALSVPSSAKRDFLAPVAHRITDEYLKHGSVSDEVLNELFETAYNSGIMEDRSFYEQYKPVKDYLRTTKITISEQDKPDVGDWKAFQKSAVGSLRLTNEGGLGVDSAYAELQGMAPSLFPDNITHPADQLQHMLNVAKDIKIAEYGTAEFLDANPDAKVWAKHDFEDAVNEMVSQMNVARRFNNEQQAKAQAKAEGKETEKMPLPRTNEELKIFYETLRKVRNKYNYIKSKNLFTDYDRSIISRLLRSELTMESVEEMAESGKSINLRGIKEAYQTALDYDKAQKIMATLRAERNKGLRDKCEELILKNSSSWGSAKKGNFYSSNTQERVIWEITKDDAYGRNNFIKLIVNPIKSGNAKAIQLTNKMKDRINALGISRKVDKGNTHTEAYAVQFIGEAQSILSENSETARNSSKENADAIRAAISEFKKANPNMDFVKIDKAVTEFRNIYNELFEMINEVRMRNGYEPIGYIKDYFPHFQSTLGDGTIMSMFKGLSVENTAALPTSINGLTQNFRPGIQYFTHAQKRQGKDTTYDALEGFDKYIDIAADIIYLTDSIQMIRQLSNQVRYRFSDEGIRNRADDILNNVALSDDERQTLLDTLFDKNNKETFKLSNWVVNLEEWANILAGKKSTEDRSMERKWGRGIYFWSRKISSNVNANLTVGNVSSWLTNFTPIATSWSAVGSNHILKGMYDTAAGKSANDDIINRSVFLTNRKGTTALAMTNMQKVGETLGKPMEAIDMFTAESVVRARYYQNLSRNMSEEMALEEADAFASSLIADRSKGAMPTRFYASNPIARAFNSFQLEVKNNIDYVTKDLIKHKLYIDEKKLVAALVKFLFGSWLYNEVYEALMKRRCTLDPIDILLDTAGDIGGFDFSIPNAVSYLSGDKDALKKEKEDVFGIGLNLAKNVTEEIPFIGGLLGGGRVPISNALPNLETVWKATTGGKRDEEGNPEWSTKKRITEGLKAVVEPAAYAMFPFGANQAKKTVEGTIGVIRGGNYGINADGDYTLKYPIYNETVRDKIVNGVKSVVLGQSSTSEADKWVKSDFDSLSKNETKAYREAIGAGVSQRDAYDMIRDLGECKKTGEQSRESVQKEYLRYSKMEGEGKLAIYYNMFASDEEKARIDALRDEDAEQVFNTLIDIGGKSTNTDKLPILIGAELSEDAKKLIYREKISDSRDDEIEAFEKVGLSFDDFLKVQSEYAKIEKEVEKEGGKKSDMALAFSRFVENGDYTKEQEEVIREEFKYFTQVAAGATTYEKYLGAGLSDSEAVGINDKLAELKPLSGKKTVSDIQKARVIVDAGLSDEKTKAALEITLSDSDAKRCKALCSKSGGIKPSVFVSFKENIAVADSIEEGGNANGGYNQAEIQRAIELVAAIYSLTPQQKGLLWQSHYPDSKNNPYSKKSKDEYSYLLENN